SRDSDCPGAHDRQIRDNPFRPIFRDQADTLAAADAQRSEAACEPADITRCLRPANRAIPSVPLRPEERFIAQPISLLEKHRRQAAAAVVIHYSPSMRCLYGFRTPREIAVVSPFTVILSVGLICTRDGLWGSVMRSWATSELTEVQSVTELDTLPE